MKKLFVILFFLFAVSAEAAAPSRQNTYVSGTVIESADVTANEDAIFNYLQAGVDTYADGTIVNADINSSANIQSDKLNLTAIAQSVANSGSTTLTGTFAANGTTNSIGNGGSDTLTLNVPGGMTLSAATTWTLTGALTFSGTIADLGTVTTADINGGTLDGVNVGGETATGMILVNDSNDDADGLGSQGTSGQFLQSAGAGANPTWGNGFRLASVTSISSSNSGDISISPSKIYQVIISITSTSADDTVLLRINSTAGTAYNWLRHGINNPGAVSTVDSGGASQSSITLGSVDVANSEQQFLSAVLYFDTFAVSTNKIRVSGHVASNTTAGQNEIVQIIGTLSLAGAVADFEILSSGGATLTGNIYVYEMPLS